MSTAPSKRGKLNSSVEAGGTHRRTDEAIDSVTVRVGRTAPVRGWPARRSPAAHLPDRAALSNQVEAVAAGDRGIEIGGGVTEGSDIADVLAILLALSLGMLAVTVVIAMLGIADLLSLSVIERTRELALLRAVGTRRGRLRAMLGVEAVTITMVGTVVGIVIGVPVGLVGVTAAVGSTAQPVIQLPWGQLALLLSAAVVVGLLAGLAPARRATRIPPAQGLTH